MKTAKTKPPKSASASALIIAVILTSLLAIIGVMFVMIARVDKMATSAISENKNLNFAVDAVVAKISQELALDVPGMLKGEDFYDYPDACNVWLASLEPYQSGSNYYWRRISDIYSSLDANNLLADVIDDYQQNIAENLSADADGDGVADSKWVKLPDMTSSKGKSIYAAVKVVDNGAMLNLNTVFANPGGPDTRKGNMLTDIYIDGLKKWPSADSITEFIDNRSNAPDAQAYHTEAARRIENPDTTTGNFYTFYDISEELSLRNRFVLIPGQTDPFMPFLSSLTRLEAYGPPPCLYYTLRQTNYGNAFTPYTSSDFGEWKRRFDPFDVGKDPNKNNYDFRHLLTTCNTDRIITPDCNMMTNINIDGVNALYDRIRRGLKDANYPPLDVNAVAAQTAVNLVDYRDNDLNNVTVYLNPDDGIPYYGFEQPCIYISELAQRFQLKSPPPPAPPPPYTLDNYDKSYAIELYKPYAGDIDPDADWQLRINGLPIPINNWTGNKQFYVIQDQNALASLPIAPGTTTQDATFSFAGGDTIELLRRAGDGSLIVVDSNKVPAGWFDLSGNPRSIQRDTSPHKCIRRLWAGSAQSSAPDLGAYNTGYSSADPNVIQAHPANSDFNNIGEIGMLFRKPAYYRLGPPIPPSDVIGYSGNPNTEGKVRLNLADPNFQQLFKYLTVFDPNADGIDNDGDGTADNGELKIHGRININTAPWFVLAQLPWMRPDIAQAIVSYRDKVDGFKGIGELMRVNKMGYYANDAGEKGDLLGFPDLTPDTAPDDFEERDVIFARISNLVTVRSDIFTAYILVRISNDGSQKRVMAILDRSNVDSPGGKVRIIALHPVPDPR